MHVGVTKDELAQEREADQTLDSLAAILRMLGDHAFDTEETKADKIRELAESWVRHLLVGGVHPEGRARNVRDFHGVRRFVEQLRRAERSFVAKALGDMRGLVRSVAQSFERALAKDADEDQRARRQIERLRAALSSNSFEELRREATEVTGALASILEVREVRRREQVEALGTELRSLHGRLEEVRKTAETCALTGLHNRRSLESYIERVVEFDGLTGVPVSMLILDVDFFKKINDTYGHQAGDEVLRSIGKELLRTFLRKCDFVGRYGGEEFIVILRDTELKHAKMLGLRLCDRMRELKLSIPDLSISISIGVSDLQPGDTASTWIERADQALLSAKRAGRDRVVVADPERAR